MYIYSYSYIFKSHNNRTEMSLQTTTDPLETRTIKWYTGLKHDHHDPRDLIRVYGTSQIPSADDHPVVDLRKYVNHVYTQGNVNSCGANVVCAAYDLLREKKAKMMNFAYYHFDASRLFVYYNSRKYDGSTEEDDGASFRDTLKAIHEKGVCKESLWPYDVKKVLQKPSPESYDDAVGNTICKYERLKQDIDQFRACLKAGFPFAFGFWIYEKSFVNISNNGLMPMPSDQEIASTHDPEMHGVLAVGYDDNTECITVLNSWGEHFGEKGYFYMPYKFIANSKRAFGFWKIEKVCNKLEIEIINLKD